jgi:putative hydrolase
MAIEWIRGRFVALIQAFYDTVTIDTSDLMGTLTSMNDPDEIQRLLNEGDGDPSGLIKGSSDPAKLAAVQAFAAFIEGYADRLVRSAGAELLPSIDRIEDAFALRRTEPNQAEQFLQQFAGLTLDRSLASDAATFCEEVVERWGPDALNKVWHEPENLPTLEEFSDPIGWAARVLLGDADFGSDPFADESPDEA